MGNSSSQPVTESSHIVEPAQKNPSIVELVQNEIIVKRPLEEMIKYFFKDYVIVWHDPNLNSEENQDHKVQLEEFCKVLTFLEWEKARDFVQQAKEICHVITSGSNGELLVEEIYKKENVHNIYVFCGNKEYHSTWAKKYEEKVVCVETRIETVLNRIHQKLMEWLKDEDSLRLNLPAFAPIFNDWDKGQMNSLHLYLKMIPNFQKRKQAKDDFVNLSKKIYSHEGDIKDIEEFMQNYNEYNKEQIFRWYSKESFLYKMTNKCLRIATSDSIQYCRLLLKDIERAIKEQYQSQSKNFNGLLFRGAYLSEQEWSSLKANLNREIEMHGFLSVSKKKNVGLKFMKSNPSQKVFITIIVPKGPNEEEQGFAEIEEFSRFPKEREILFNVRSRFTVLETEDEYSKELPYRHLVLLYGAQGFRQFITKQNPIQKVSIPEMKNISCSHCKERIFEMPEKFYFVPFADSRKGTYYCKKCTDFYSGPFLCVPVLTDKAFETKAKGCLLVNADQRQTPFYGYKCCSCQAKKQKAYFRCTDCCGKKCCENCFEEEALTCMEAKHNIIIEKTPYSFWSESMSPNELNHLTFQNEIVKKNNHLFQQAEMYFESHEYEKAKEYYSLYIQENEGKGKDATVAVCFNNIGVVHASQGEYKKAVEYHLKSLKIRKSVYGFHHSSVAISYNNLGAVYEKQGAYEEALEYYLKSLVIRKSVYVLTNIGMVYRCQGKYDKALEYLFTSLDIYKSDSREDHPDVATAYNNIGMVYQNQKEYSKALEYYLKSLEIKKSVYGDNNPSVATSYNNIGGIYDNQGEYKQALEYYFKSLDIYKSVYRDNHHPDISTSYSNIGSVYSKQRDYKQALEYDLKSLDIRRSFYGDKHPDVATSYNNIGLTYKNLGEYNKAVEYYLKSLDIRKSLNGDNHLDVATSYDNVGRAYKNLREYKRALEYYLKSLEIRKSVYGEHHLEVATSYSNIGGVYDNQGEYKQALVYDLKSLEIRKSIYGDNHLEVASSYNNIGRAYKNLKEYRKALEYHLKSLDIRKSICGANHLSVATAYSKIASLYNKLKEFKQALAYYSESLNIKKSFYGENHPDVAILYDMIGSIYYFQSEHKMALESYIKALDIRKSLYGDNHPDIATSFRNVGSIYQSRGEYKKAIESFQHSLDIKYTRSIHERILQVKTIDQDSQWQGEI